MGTLLKALQTIHSNRLNDLKQYVGRLYTLILSMFTCFLIMCILYEELAQRQSRM